MNEVDYYARRKEKKENDQTYNNIHMDHSGPYSHYPCLHSWRNRFYLTIGKTVLSGNYTCNCIGVQSQK